MTKKGLFKIKMDYQEKILYMGLLTIMEMLIEMVPKDKFDETFSDDTKSNMINLTSIVFQRLNEIEKSNELG